MLYDICRWYAIVTAYPVFQWLFFKRKTYYEEGAPRRPWKQGGALIISNHYNFLDYMMNMFLVLPKKLYVIASEYSFRNRWMKFAVRFWGAIEANRVTKSMRFMDTAADLIRRGKLVQIFPEGHNTDDGNIHPFKKSYIVIAHRANAPIIPIVTDGNYGFFKRVHVIVGKPILVSDYITSNRRTPTREELEQVNDIIFQKVLSLREELEARKASEGHKSHSERNSKHA